LSSAYRYRCDYCSLEFKTSGPWPFFRDEQGRTLIAKEAHRKGACGLLAEVFCLQCCRPSQVVLVERGGREVGAAPPEGRRGAAAGEPAATDARWPSRCPRCGSDRLLLAPDLETEVPCPACGQGHLRGRVLANHGGFEP
jgi:hypothetical protein